MNSIAPAARFAAPSFPFLAAETVAVAAWLNLADQGQLWAALERLGSERLDAVHSVALAIDVDRLATAHDRGDCCSSCGFCPSTTTGEAL